MTELFDQLPATVSTPTSAASGERRLSANGRPIGRPPGARNRRSGDLAKWVEAEFGGMTPGQQSAELALARPRDLKRARADLEQLVKLNLVSPAVLDLRLGALEAAQLVKAVRLAKVLGCDADHAWGMLAAERANLMRYVHQVQPQAKPKDAAQLPTMFVVDKQDLEAAAADATPDPGDVDFAEDFDLPAEQVSQSKSHDDD